MPAFSEISVKKLKSCDNGLQLIFNEVIKDFDCRVVYGYRKSEEQMDLWKQGRAYIKDEWVITDRTKIVTYCDGYAKKSKHNYMPSQAVDVLPFPIDYKDIERIYYFAGWVKCTAKRLKINLTWGGDWDNDTQVKDQSFMDISHYELK
jgi:peptidoglycan L-alanyl-D-glutamate endopeptidase CwlK